MIYFKLSVYSFGVTDSITLNVEAPDWAKLAAKFTRLRKFLVGDEYHIAVYMMSATDTLTGVHKYRAISGWKLKGEVSYDTALTELVKVYRGMPTAFERWVL